MFAFLRAGLAICGTALAAVVAFPDAASAAAVIKTQPPCNSGGDTCFNFGVGIVGVGQFDIRDFTFKAPSKAKSWRYSAGPHCDATYAPPQGTCLTDAARYAIDLVPPGKAGRVTLHGETARDGRLPINPSGGLKARGHPLAATGIAQIVECVWQLTHRAGARQVPGRVALAHSIGGLATNNWITLLETVG